MAEREPRKRPAKRGVSVTGTDTPESRDKRNGTVTVSLRIPASMLKEVDKAVKSRPYRMPRHMWLLEAVHEKIARFKENRTNNQ
jgi:nicotinamide mononucleotide (NMN) deamidase PncC